ncbi:MAG: trigger factor [Parcubacteria group bacterium]|nr:trigger factor [Parcubacteria group bacterium]
MKIDIKNLPQSEIEINFELNSEEMASFRQKALAELAKLLKIDGFRPGQVPAEIAKTKIQPIEIEEKAAELAIHKYYPEAILEKNIPAIGRPQIEILKIAPDNPLVFRAKTAILPKISLPDWNSIAKSIKKQPENITVKSEEIEKTLHWLQKSRAQHQKVDRPAIKGDLVEIDFEGRIDKILIENGVSKNHPVVLGDGKFLPEFEKNLIGLKTGEEKEFSITFPKDYHQKKLAGKIVDFKVKINAVEEIILPELNDEFVKNLGKFSDIASLKKSVEEGIKQEKEQKEKDRIRLEIINAVADKTDFEIPETLIENEIEKMMAEFQTSLSNMGLNLEDYLAGLGKTKEEIKKDWKKEAEKRVKIALILREIGQVKNIQPEEKEIEERMHEYLKNFSSPQQAQKKIDPQDLREYTMGVLRNEKVFQLLEKLVD